MGKLSRNNSGKMITIILAGLLLCGCGVNGNNSISKENEYFAQTESEEYTYETVNFFMEDISAVQLRFNNISSYEDGDVYEIAIQADDLPERYDIDNHDRYNIGTFYVTEDKIYALFNHDEVPTKEDFLSGGVVVCDSNDSDEIIDGYEMKIVNEGDTCTFSMWNTLVESGYYCSMVWTKNKGLTSYRSGFGAERDPIELILNGIEITENAEDETASETEVEEDSQDNILVKNRDEIDLDEESAKLYDGFVDGTKSAQFVETGDTTTTLCLSDVLDDGQSYTLPEIEHLLCEKCDAANDWIYENNISDSYIDAGLDGAYELKADIGAAVFNITLIVKNIDGELKICFAGDSIECSQTNVLFTGEVQYENKRDNDSHDYVRGFINDSGEYNFWVQYTEDGYNILQDGDLYHSDEYIGTGIGMYIQKFSFNRDFSDAFYSIGIVDDENKHITPNESDPKDSYKIAQDILVAEGKKVLPSDEVKKLIEQRRTEIGLEDKVYFYGDENSN